MILPNMASSRIGSAVVPVLVGVMRPVLAEAVVASTEVHLISVVVAAVIVQKPVPIIIWF